MKPNNKTSAILIIIIVTFFGLYASFELQKSGSVSNASWYHTFIPYVTPYDALYPPTDSKERINKISEMYINAGLKTLRTKVLLVTFICFLISLFLAYRVYYKNADMTILWRILLIILLYGIFVGF